MAANTAIEWATHTFNVVWGCQKVSPGCTGCYAETWANRYGFDVWGPAKTTGRRTFGEKHWSEPLKWEREAARTGARARVFCSSMADVFEDHPAYETERPKLWHLIEQTPHLDWLLLTKRPENFRAFLPSGFRAEPWPNVWLGVSAENQEYADKRIPYLLDVPAVVRFLSCEPLLGTVDLERVGAIERAGPGWAGYNAHVDWVIAGGESGPKARPMHQRWPRQLRDQCEAANTAFFFKQHGEWIGVADYDPLHHGAMSQHPVRSIWETYAGDPDDLPMLHVRVGKKLAGRLLDGQEWNQFPKINIPA